MHVRVVRLEGDRVRRRDADMFRGHFTQHCVLVNGLSAWHRALHGEVELRMLNVTEDELYREPEVEALVAMLRRAFAEADKREQARPSMPKECPSLASDFSN